MSGKKGKSTKASSPKSKSEKASTPKKQSKKDTHSDDFVQVRQDSDFDLDTIIEQQLPFRSGAGGSAGPGTERKYTTTPKLDNYIEVPQAEWERLPVNTYVRYFDLDGNWRPGGRVKSIKLDTAGVKGFQVVKFNPKQKKSLFWIIKFTSIKKLYKFNTPQDPNVPARPLQIKTATGTNSVVGAGPVQAVQTAQSVTSMQSVPPESVEDAESFREDHLLRQLGDKLLFDDKSADSLKQRIESVEAEVARMSQELKKLFVLIKRVYVRLEKSGN
jgi:hypothetical protein